MPNTWRRWVAILSVVCAVFGVAACVADSVRGQSVPLWDWAVMIYGGVFSLFLIFDYVGRTLAMARRAADARRGPLPSRRPVPPERSVVMAESPQSLQLTRVRAADKEWFDTMARAAATEVAALEHGRPGATACRIEQINVQAWLDSPQTYTFFFLAGAERVGACAVESSRSLALLRMFYVESQWRRRHIGRMAMQELLQFLSLAGFERVLVEVARTNLRARNFFAVCGFRPTGAEEGEADVWERRLQASGDNEAAPADGLSG
ncbi:GNAT family N-acetyltransferase [Alicyclobacillus shizuokensis]|uniref:GNAT family N-acetyltransferase n=1 Tax=Alicyclobacillus shizuokensis TaxID=392014 RepID=UPI0008295187|nr:GNAT family N-acetyltransferase [Alicyclobacillus shizuokensis]MCL6626707.1 GNAT family N-acetyltransferase [Alicyclobacillus shizuokensis]